MSAISAEKGSFGHNQSTGRTMATMNIQVIIAHPRPDSFCHGLLQHVAERLKDAGHDLLVHDLYAEGFDPVLRAEETYTTGDAIEQTLARASDPVVQQHRSEIAQAQGLLVVHPNWWGKPPAMLAGWMDRILVPGVAYRLESGEGLPAGLLKIRSALILNTSDTPADREAMLGDPLQRIWENCVLPYCGVASVTRRMFGPIAGSAPAEREAWLDEAAALARHAFPDT
ncbi:MAG: NAD(P)H-dependent oxidoreductase [Burkholderiaceae bacterium]